jgi:type VI secretion system protein ImpG
MRDDLLFLYERELSFLRRTGAQFAERYPKVASRLQLEPNKCDDPHVERLLEGFAFVSARTQLKLEDDFSEFSEALLNVLYPHFTRPIPSFSLAELHLDREQGKLAQGVAIPRDTVVESRPVQGVPCKFRTCYDTTLWPLNVRGARWLSPFELQPPVRQSEAVAALRLELACFPGLRFDELALETLRLHISAEANLSAALYELLANNCIQILVRDPEHPSRPPIELPASALRPVGFGPDERLLPQPRHAFAGYALLQEYFTFPDKFFFFDLSGFGAVREAGFGERAEVVFLISAFERAERRPMLEAGVSERTFRLGCTPIVNLFAQTSEPILLTQRLPEYTLVPDARRRAWTHTFSVEEVVAVTAGTNRSLRFEPFYSLRHGTRSEQERLYWFARRRPISWRADEGTEVVLSFVDAGSRLAHPDVTAITARLLCFNGDLPSRLPFGAAGGDLELPGGGPVTKITTLVKPTPALQPPLGKPQIWRLVSQLSLNYLSLVDGDGEALRELLHLNNFAGSASGEMQIRGITRVHGEPTYSRLESEYGLTFARGQRVEVEFDEEQFAGGSVYLLASVLDHLFGMSISLNSFCTLAARTRQRREVLRQWPPRSGWKSLV